MLFDPIPFEHVTQLVANAEPARRIAIVREAWRDYAAKAARPYAWQTFSLYVRRRAAQHGTRVRRSQLPPLQEAAPAKPRVLVLGSHAALRVRRGALEIEHGPKSGGQDIAAASGGPARASLRIDVDARAKPEAILFDSLGEFVTGEAIRFCARYSIALIWPCGPGRLVTAIETEIEARDRKTARKRDIEPAIILAQCAAAMDRRVSADIARAIVRAKIEAQAKGVTSEPARRGLAEWGSRLADARTLSAVMIVEANAAATYWREFRHVGLREAKGERLPRSWLRHPMRNRAGPAFFMSGGEAVKASPKHAAHPVNAMLNYAYIVEAGRVARALTARGLVLQIGFLHKLKRGRNSLVWDAIEPLRPAIDARVLAFITEHEFRRADFPEAGLNVVRLSREVTQFMLHSVMLSRSEIEAAADWMAGLIARPGCTEGT